LIEKREDGELIKKIVRLDENNKPLEEGETTSYQTYQSIPFVSYNSI
jgi:hypothetical protein